MPNTAFRIAFWALFISLWLCVTAAVISPQPRLAWSEPEALPPSPQIVLGTPRPFPGDARIATADVGARFPAILPQPAETTQPIPEPVVVERRVPDPYQRSMPASLAPPVNDPPVEAVVEDRNVVIPPPWSGGSIPAVAEPAIPVVQLAPPDLAPVPPPTSTPLEPYAPQPSNADLASAELTATPAIRGVYEELPPPDSNLFATPPQPTVVAPVDPVPQPAVVVTTVQPAPPSEPISDELVQAVRDLRDELTQLHITQLQREVELARRELAETDPKPAVAAKPEPQSELPAEPLLAVGPTAIVSEEPQTEPAPPVAPNMDSTIKDSKVSVQPGETEGRWSFEFREAPLSEVLLTLAECAGQEVLIEPGLEGTLSQSFRNVNAAQAFATVIKLHNLGVDFRGQTLLVRRSAMSRLRDSQ